MPGTPHHHETAPWSMLAWDLSEAIDRARTEYAPELPDIGPDSIERVMPELLAALNKAADPAPPQPARVLTSTGATKHTCTPDGQALPFGRKAPEGECARCDELRAGAAPRADYAAGRRGWNYAPTAEDRDAHLAYCTACQTGGVCTAGQW